MNQIWSIFVQYLQSISAALVMIMALHLGGALAGTSAANDIQNTDQAGMFIPIVSAAYGASRTISTIPLVVLAEPGRAFVLSIPNRQIQVRIESGNTACKQTLGQTNSSGLFEIPIAATAHCAAPRLVVMH